MLLSSHDLTGFAAAASVRRELEFLVVCRDNPVFQTVAAAIRHVKGRLTCASSAAIARDYVAWRRVDGIVIDMDLPGALELVRRIRRAGANCCSAVFSCVGSSGETQPVIGAGANFLLHRPLIPGKVARVLAAAADMMVAERRAYLRYPLMVPVELKMQERRVESTMSNLSEGGMAIWSLYYHTPGSPIQFAFEIPFGGLIRGDGEVAWTNADGLTGIRFRVLSDQGQTHLSAWLARRNSER